ncbi:sensor histidine kinase [Spirosoma rhododendri]|uniref:histidine kinase n=1 Tax=Spirosoma rhododendri TaxID=2728024 RepID=A0A7L5DPH9_9BACT|nr:PAS domain-containing sensor histidine kinase [Spirosoma rhododendri]QJD79381.1 PAS domain-containing protein [Spirosoma rhododendri]
MNVEHQVNSELGHLFQHIINDSQTGICVLDAVRDAAGTVLDFRFSLINPAGTDILGHHPEKLIGKSLIESFSQVEKSGFLDLYRGVLDSGKSARLLEVPYFADGVEGWFDINVTKYQDSVIVTFVDMSTLKRIQIAEKKQAAFFNQLLQTSPSGVVAYEAVRARGADGESTVITDFRAIFFNATYERMFGESASTIYSRSFRERFDHESDAELFPFYADIVTTGHSFQHERYYKRQQKWLQLSGEKLFDGFLLIINDITAQKEAELAQQKLTEALQLANQELIRSNVNLQQFAYIASHDLQEPLRKIQSFGNLLQLRYSDSLGNERDYIDRMQTAAVRMSTLIRDLLSYSRISTRRDKSQSVALNTVVDEVLSDLQISIAEAKADIQVDPLPTVIGDATQLGQLFQNLIGNALKFRRADTVSQITISYRRVLAHELPGTIKPVQAAGAYHCIDLTDNGIGFDEKYLDRIFQVFQRLHGKSEFAGTGIGLAICEKVAVNHGGAITASSRPGVGTTFSVYLPD